MYYKYNNDVIVNYEPEWTYRVRRAITVIKPKILRQKIEAKLKKAVEKVPVAKHGTIPMEKFQRNYTGCFNDGMFLRGCVNVSFSRTGGL